MSATSSKVTHCRMYSKLLNRVVEIVRTDSGVTMEGVEYSLDELKALRQRIPPIRVREHQRRLQAMAEAQAEQPTLLDLLNEAGFAPQDISDRWDRAMKDRRIRAIPARALLGDDHG